MPASEMLARRPKGVILSGGPKSVYAAVGPVGRRRALRLGPPGARHLLRRPAARPRSRRRGRPGPGPASTAARRCWPGRRSVLMDRWESPTDVWMSHADSIVGAPAGFAVTAVDRRGRRRRARGPGAGRLRRPVPPRGGAHDRGQELLKRFLFEVCDCRPHVDAHLGHRVAGRGGPRPGRRRPRALSRSRGASTRPSPRRSSTRRSASS